MNEFSGYIELELGGELIPFKFGTNAWALFCQERKIEYWQIAETGIFGRFKDGKMIAPPDIFALRELFFDAYVSAVRAKKELPKHNLEGLTDLLDEETDATRRLQDTMLKSKMLGYSFTDMTEESKKK